MNSDDCAASARDATVRDMPGAADAQQDGDDRQHDGELDQREAGCRKTAAHERDRTDISLSRPGKPPIVQAPSWKIIPRDGALRHPPRKPAHARTANRTISMKPWLLTLALAEQAVGLSDPNPRVGCLIVSADGAAILGQGHTQAAGGPHAEVMALRDAQARGHDVRGATVYVTLEPCAHHGRTPPCCDALVAAGVGRVEIAVGDPNPLVNGQGTARIAAAGIAIGHAPDDIALRARELNIGFFSRMERGRPWVRMKIAASLDGRTALPNGASQWITGADARADGHAFRRARARCSPASAPCWPTIRRWTCAWSRPRGSRCAASSTRAWTRRPRRACSTRRRR